MGVVDSAEAILIELAGPGDDAWMGAAMDMTNKASDFLHASHFLLTTSSNYLALSGTRLVGFLTFDDASPPHHRFGEDDPVLRVSQLFVHPQFRRRGIASRLLAAVEDHAKRSGLSFIEFLVDPYNASMLSLAREFGAESRHLVPFHKFVGPR